MTTRRPASLASLTLALLVGLTAAGCGLLRAPLTQPTRFYVLDSTVDAGDIPPGRRLVIGIGPISVPPYVERPEMVTRVAPNQLAFDEFHRWSEPLKDNVVRVFAADLDRLIGFERVVPYPWYRNTPLDYTVSVALLRFEPQGDGTVVLDARWGIGDGHGQVLANRESHFERRGGTPEANAAALSDLVSDLARDVAAGLRALDATPGLKKRD